MKLFELIDKSFIEPIKHNQAEIGIEAEMPLIPVGGGKVETSFIKELTGFVIGMGFTPTDRTHDGIVSEMNDTEHNTFSFDTSWNTVEFSLMHKKDINALYREYTSLLIPIQRFCMENNYFLCGRGINPNYAKFDPAPIGSSVFDAYTNFLKKYTWHHDGEIFHSLCASVQTHFSAPDVPTFLKMFRLLRKAYVFDALFFANSLPPDNAFIEGRPALQPITRDTLCCRDDLWKYSGAPNTQLLNVRLDTEDDYRRYIRSLKLFIVKKDGKLTAMAPCDLDEYCNGSDWTEEMFTFFRSFEPVAPTKFGTMELRSTCIQPLDAMMEPTAFYAGLLAVADDAAALIDGIYGKYFPGLEPPQVRALLMKRSDAALRAELRDDGRKLLSLSIKGLEKRGFGEEKLLKALIARIEQNGWRVPAECWADDVFEQTKQQMKNIEKECCSNVDK